MSFPVAIVIVIIIVHIFERGIYSVALLIQFNFSKAREISHFSRKCVYLKSVIYMSEFILIFSLQSKDRSLFENHRLFSSVVEKIIVILSSALNHSVFESVKNYVEK